MCNKKAAQRLHEPDMATISDSSNCLFQEMYSAIVFMKMYKKQMFIQIEQLVFKKLAFSYSRLNIVLK